MKERLNLEEFIRDNSKRHAASLVTLSPDGARNAERSFEEVWNECERIAARPAHPVIFGAKDEVRVSRTKLSSVASIRLLKYTEGRVTSVPITCTLDRENSIWGPAITVARPTDGWMGFPSPLTFLFDRDGRLVASPDGSPLTPSAIAQAAFEKTLDPRNAIPPTRLQALDLMEQVHVECKARVSTVNPNLPPNRSLVIHNLLQSEAGLEAFWVSQHGGGQPTRIGVAGASRLEISIPRTDSNRLWAFAINVEGRMRRIVNASAPAIEHIAGNVVVPSLFGVPRPELSQEGVFFNSSDVAELALKVALGSQDLDNRSDAQAAMPKWRKT